MNSNQKAQVDKIVKILRVNEEIERKISNLSDALMKNKEKIEKIEHFLFKQKVTVEEIESYLQSPQEESEEVKSFESTETSE